MEDVLKAVTDEVKRAEQLHPSWPANMFEAITIITEEVGELAQAALDMKFKKNSLAHVQEEAVQTAAMAIRFLIHLEKYRLD